MTMKIFDNTTPISCSFDELAPGEVFKSSDGFFYMKLYAPLFEEADEDAQEVQAILLATGEPAVFYFSECVYRVEATLTITPSTLL